MHINKSDACEAQVWVMAEAIRLDTRIRGSVLRAAHIDAPPSRQPAKLCSPLVEPASFSL
eukprot:2829932-Pleurochrysis_carterae.AAC.1